MGAAKIDSEKATGKGRVMKVDMGTEPAQAPVGDLDVNELNQDWKELRGKVVELEFDRVEDLKKVNDRYVARVTFESDEPVGMRVLVPEEGIPLFERVAEQRDYRESYPSSVYVKVCGNNIFRAVGLRYGDYRPEGERYNW